MIGELSNLVWKALLADHSFSERTGHGKVAQDKGTADNPYEYVTVGYFFCCSRDLLFILSCFEVGRPFRAWKWHTTQDVTVTLHW